MGARRGFLSGSRNPKMLLVPMRGDKMPTKPDGPCPVCGRQWASVCGCDMKLPPHETCGTCAHWPRCKALIFTLDYYAESCDFSPSRFKLAEKEGR